MTDSEERKNILWVAKTVDGKLKNIPFHQAENEGGNTVKELAVVHGNSQKAQCFLIFSERQNIFQRHYPAIADKPLIPANAVIPAHAEHQNQHGCG